MLFLDGVYVDGANGSTRFRWVKAPTGAELTNLTHRIAHRVGRFLEQQGLLERDAENSHLVTDAVNEDPMNTLLGHSITYRIAVGPQQGRKVFTLQTLPACDEPFGDQVGNKEAPGSRLARCLGLSPNKELAMAMGERASAEQGEISRWRQVQGDALPGNDPFASDEMGGYSTYTSEVPKLSPVFYPELSTQSVNREWRYAKKAQGGRMLKFLFQVIPNVVRHVHRWVSNADVDWRITHR